MRVVHEPENTGCAGGWNRVLAADPHAPWWLVVNDDITFPPGALRNIAARVWARLDTQPDAGHFKFWCQHTPRVVLGLGQGLELRLGLGGRAGPNPGLTLTRYQHGASGWSCFALTARAVRAVGRFDENIYPVYYEDEDYELRLRHAGLRSAHLAASTRGSTALSLPQRSPLSV